MRRNVLAALQVAVVVVLYASEEPRKLTGCKAEKLIIMSASIGHY